MIEFVCWGKITTPLLTSLKISYLCVKFYRMGGKLEDLEFKKRNFVPGPGTHDPEKRNDIPSMKFGSGQRSEMKSTSLSPGPGGYD